MKNVGIGILGSRLDRRGKGQKRWNKWRPTLGVVQQPELPLHRFELLHETQELSFATRVAEDIQCASPGTEVILHEYSLSNPWDFEEMYGALLDFAEGYRFAEADESYYVHITTGTHVAQICWYLLCEANYIPAKLLQSSPGKEGAAGSVNVIDLDLSKYDKIASRFDRQYRDNLSFLKSGIETRNKKFNQMIEQMEVVAVRSSAPMLITGPTGAGKSQLAQRLYQLKHQRGQVRGEFVSVNCATLRGDAAMSMLFGHVKGAFTGAQSERAGMLAKADGGVLFLDEIGELGLDEQAMLLHAIEEKSFYPMGSDRVSQSDFQLIAGTNRDLAAAVLEGRFREDLLARINLWRYRLPGLAERSEDLAPNIDYELQQLEKEKGHKVSFNADARKHYLDFALSPSSIWQNNFRDLNASMVRMATLAEGGRIRSAQVDEEIERLQEQWQGALRPVQSKVDLNALLDAERMTTLDDFDRQQLEYVVGVCRESRSLSDAGRRLFDKSRLQKQSTNDGHRLRQYLAKFGLKFNDLN